MSDFAKVNELSILLGARRPQWVLQTPPTAPGTNGVPAVGDGVFLENSPKTLVAIAVREESVGRNGRITIPVFDLASTYTVEINTETVATAAVTDRPTTIQAIADAINADTGPGAGDFVQATAIESDPGVSGIDTVLLQGIKATIPAADATWVLTDLSVSGGAGTIAAVLDTDGVDARAWFTGKSPNAPGATSSGGAGQFYRAQGASYTVTKAGFFERFDTAGLDRMYIELLNPVLPADAAGAGGSITYRPPTVHIGPSVRGSGE